MNSASVDGESQGERFDERVREERKSRTVSVREEGVRIILVAAGAFREEFSGRGRGEAACAGFFHDRGGEGDCRAVQQNFRSVRTKHDDHCPVFPAVRGLTQAVLDADGVGAGPSAKSASCSIPCAACCFRLSDGLSGDSRSHVHRLDRGREAECLARSLNRFGLDRARGSQSDVHDTCPFRS